MKNTDLEISSPNIAQCFSNDKNIVYVIPKYQREYSWGAKQWEKLFDDIIENNGGHFLGTIIYLQKHDYNPDGTIDYEVIDGQQRLTTITILLAAIFNAISSLDESKFSRTQKRTYWELNNRLVYIGDDESQVVMRLKPQVQNSNLQDLQYLFYEAKLIENKTTKPRYYKTRRIKKAFKYFEKRLKSYMEYNSDQGLSFIFDFLQMLYSCMFVTICPSTHANAYALFESLNNRGIPLTAVDLIKNKLLSQMDSDHKNVDQCAQDWSDFIYDLGEEYKIQERFFRQNYNAFRSYLNNNFTSKETDKTYPLGKVATRSSILSIYESIIEFDPAKTMEMLKEHGHIYSLLVYPYWEGYQEELNDNLRKALFNIDCCKGTPSFVLLLYLLKNMDSLGLSFDDLASICHYTTCFFVRRNLTNNPPTHSLNSMFMEFIESIEQYQLKGSLIEDHLRKLYANVSVSDEEFEIKLRGPIYEDNVDMTRFVLCSLAQKAMTIETWQDLWAYKSKSYIWSIEHIFPQGENIPPQWVEMIANGDQNLAQEYHADYVHTLGNLTLTAFNSNLSNRSFTIKRDLTNKDKCYIGYRNGLSLNKDVADKDEWTVENIKNRTDRLVQETLKLFAL